MNAELRGVCEGEIVTCFWNSTMAVTESSGSQIVLPRVKSAARTLWIHMLRWILILHDSSIRIKWSKEKEEVAIAVLFIVLAMLLVCYTFKTLWRVIVQTELKEIIHIVVCKPNKAQQSSFQTIELTWILPCFIISVSLLFYFTFKKNMIDDVYFLIYVLYWPKSIKHITFYQNQKEFTTVT